MKLTIESIPLSLWGVNLRDKLGTVAWAKVRSACYAKAGHVCEICGGVGPKHPVECHEIWAYDDERRIQKLAGFIALCPACHEVKHYGRACAGGRAAQAQQHFLNVNGCTPQEMRAHIENAKARWIARSRAEWTQDLSWFQEASDDFAPATGSAPATNRNYLLPN